MHPRPMELRPQIRRRQVQNLTNFLAGNALDLAKREGVGHRVGQISQTIEQNVPKFVAFQGTIDVGPRFRAVAPKTVSGKRVRFQGVDVG